MKLELMDEVKIDGCRSNRGMILELKEGSSFAQLCCSGTIFALTQVASMMQEDPEDRVDPMARVFPRVTKCTFKKFGLKSFALYLYG